MGALLLAMWPAAFDACVDEAAHRVFALASIVFPAFRLPICGILGAILLVPPLHVAIFVLAQAFVLPLALACPGRPCPRP